MTGEVQNDNERSQMIEFLTEDLKETGELLRDTDRKLSTLIQIYAGAFVLVGTLATNGLIDGNALFNGLGIQILVVLVFLFTFWLYYYALKSKETKQAYMLRMNFLRREMHYYLRTRRPDLAGYWTASRFAKPKDISEATPPKSARRKPGRVGLDDLYPKALNGTLVILVALFAMLVWEGIHEAPASVWNKSPLLIGALALVLLALVFSLTASLDRKVEERIEIHKATYAESTESTSPEGSPSRQ
jgi:hypothetical protein